MKEFDISSEVWREYEYEDEYTFRINPETLFISDSGSHRVLDIDGVVHYIRGDWRQLRWYPGNSQKPVLF